MELNKKSFLLAIFLFCGFESYADESELAKQVQNNTESINDMQKKIFKNDKRAMDAQHKAIIAQSTADNAKDRVDQAFVDIKVNTSAINELNDRVTVNTKDINELNDRVTVNTKDISDLKNKFNGEFKSIYDKIEENKKEYKAGIASAMAMTSIPQAFNSGSGLLGIGAATYKGQSAIAIGGSKVSENGRWITKFSVSSNSQYDYGAGLGFGYQF